jgi:hypothetical protein
MIEVKDKLCLRVCVCMYRTINEDLNDMNRFFLCAIHQFGK